MDKEKAKQQLGSWLVVVIIICIIAFVEFIGYYHAREKADIINQKMLTILPGQQYTHVFGLSDTINSDPFKERRVDTICIIAIKCDYVQYGFIKHGKIFYRTSTKLKWLAQDVDKRIK